jgi:hypothetical protein
MSRSLITLALVVAAVFIPTSATATGSATLNVVFERIKTAGNADIVTGRDRQVDSATTDECTIGGSC